MCKNCSTTVPWELDLMKAYWEIRILWDYCKKRQEERAPCEPPRGLETVELGSGRVVTRGSRISMTIVVKQRRVTTIATQGCWRRAEVSLHVGYVEQKAHMPPQIKALCRWVLSYKWLADSSFRKYGAHHSQRICVIQGEKASIGAAGLLGCYTNPRRASMQLAECVSELERKRRLERQSKEASKTRERARLWSNMCKGNNVR